MAFANMALWWLLSQVEAPPATETVPHLSAPADVEGADSASAPSSRPASPAADADAADLADLQAALTDDEQQAHTQRPAAAVNPAADTWSAGGGLIPSSALNPAIAVIGDVALASFSGPAPLQAGAHDPQESGFVLQQLELSLQGAVDPYFTYAASLVASAHGLELEEAYGTTLRLPAGLQARAGQLLTRFGRQNATHPHAWSFVDGSLVLGRLLGEEGQRGVGAELSVLLPLPWYVEPVVAVVAADEHEHDDDAAQALQPADWAPLGNLQHAVAMAALKQFWPLGKDLSLAWGLSTALVSSEHAGAHDELYATDLFFKWRPLGAGDQASIGLETEGLYRRRVDVGGTSQDLGALLQLVWQLDRHWAVAARYEVLSGELGQPGYTGDGPVLSQRAQLNATLWPTEFSRLRLQYGLGVAADRERPVHALMLALELVAGAHGAHRF